MLTAVNFPAVGEANGVDVFVGVGIVGDGLGYRVCVGSGKGVGVSGPLIWFGSKCGSIKASTTKMMIEAPSQASGRIL